MSLFKTATQISTAFKNVGRAREIVMTFASHGFGDLIQRMGLSKLIPTSISQSGPYSEMSTGERLRLSFERLGPTFVKLGQVLATRPDLIPEPVVEELRKLQDNVKPVPFQEIKPWIESELKKSISEVFSEFDEKPIAAASIAQVHLAKLKDGTPVAVKVQRPGIERLIQNDLSILKTLTGLLEKYVPETKPLNPVGFVEEFIRSLLLELNFYIEANNIRRIKKNLQSHDKIRIPEVYINVSCQKVLVLERFEGVRFSDREKIIAMGIAPRDVIETGIHAFFHMVLKDGLFHGDLHGGNLFVLNDAKIGLVDFGIVGRLTRKVQDSVVNMFVALVEEDYETLAYEYTNLCYSPSRINLPQFQKDLMDAISPYVGMALGEINIGQVLLRSTSIAVKHELQVPRELMLLFKAILTVESLGKQLDPDFDILSMGHSLASQIIQTRYNPDRIKQDLFKTGKDIQAISESLPRLLRRFLREWSQRGFAIEIHNPGEEALLAKIQRLKQTLVLCSFSIILTAIGITLAITQATTLSVWSLGFLGLAIGLMVAEIFAIRKPKPPEKRW